MSDSFEPKRELTYTFKIWCASTGVEDRARVEELLDLTLQEMVMDDGFATALDETEAFTIQLLDNNPPRNG
jgi:hypothetical protein